MFRETQSKNIDHAAQQFARLFIAYLDSKHARSRKGRKLLANKVEARNEQERK